YGTESHKVWKSAGVPGPPPAPFFGNIHQLFNVEIGVRRSVKKWQEKYGRIFGIYFFHKPVLVVTDPEAMKRIFVKDFNIFVDRFFVGEGKLQHSIIQKTLFFAQGHSWKRLRKMVNPAFTSGKLKLLMGYINRTAGLLSEQLLDSAKKGTPVEAKTVFGAYALDVIVGTAFGLDINSQNDLSNPLIQHARSLTTIDKIVQLKLTIIGIFPSLIPVFRAFKIGYFRYKDVNFFRETLLKLISEKKHTKSEQSDLLQLLMDVEADPSDGDVLCQKLSDEEVAAQCLLFMIAGYDATSSALQYFFYELARYPQIQEKIYSEIVSVLGEDEELSYESCLKMKYLEAAVEEILRMYPLLHTLTRNTVKETTLNGMFIPANSAVLIPAYNVGRDPEFFHNPDTFIPERFLESSKHDINPVTFIPFGYGPRQCIGLRLAMMELKIAIVHVLRRLRISKATPEVLEIEDYSGGLVSKIPVQLFMEVRS
ncbi:cytochrome P450 3A19, partial [Biomphalaria pfeifferi]